MRRLILMYAQYDNFIGFGMLNFPPLLGCHLTKKNASTVDEIIQQLTAAHFIQNTT